MASKENKNTYEKLIGELNKEGKIIPMTGLEHLNLMKELNQGLAQFNQNQKLQEHYAFNSLCEIQL